MTPIRAIRIPDDQYSRLHQAARAAGLSWSQWARAILLEAANENRHPRTAEIQKTAKKA